MKGIISKKCRKGSSSILIIMIIIALVLFGILSVISAYSSYRISEKSALYTNMNYEMESAAAELQAKAIEQMRNAAAQAVQYRLQYGQADNRENYWSTLKKRMSEDAFEDISEFRMEEDVQRRTLRMHIVFAKAYPSGEEKFVLGMEFLYPQRPIENPADVDYRIISWSKLPKEMHYEDVIEFENIEVEGMQTEEEITP